MASVDHLTMTTPDFADQVMAGMMKQTRSDSVMMLPNRFLQTPPPEAEADVLLPWTQLHETIAAPASIVAVIGVGYIGTHLVEAFASQYKVIAYDVNVERLNTVGKMFENLPVNCTSDAHRIGEASHILIAVPTILKEDRSIDDTYLCTAIETVKTHARPGSTIVIESSVAVGMTRRLVGPLMMSKNFKVGMSPERVDPGRTFPSFQEIPKIVSGIDDASLEPISELYSKVFGNVLPVSSPEVAEMTKLYENCQRMVCAAYANEMADACEALGIDALEVSSAAASKPFGYLPFKPGPGVGGHCIPVNPYYLLSTCSMPLLEHATTLSWQRPADIAGRFAQSVLSDRKSNAATATTSAPSQSSRPRTLVVGMGFKRGQSVMSNSSGVAIARALADEWAMDVSFADPLVSSKDLPNVHKMDTARNWNAEYLTSHFDGIVVAVDQVGLDMSVLDGLQGVQIVDYSGRRREV